MELYKIKQYIGKEYSSNIITNEKDKETFENILTNTNNIKLIYRICEDGRDNNKMLEIIQCCFNHIIIIKTKEANIIGCYFRNAKIDNESIIFSIDKPNLYIYKQELN